MSGAPLRAVTDTYQHPAAAILAGGPRRVQAASYVARWRFTAGRFVAESKAVPPC